MKTLNVVLNEYLTSKEFRSPELTAVTNIQLAVVALNIGERKLTEGNTRHVTDLMSSELAEFQYNTPADAAFLGSLLDPLVAVEKNQKSTRPRRFFVEECQSIRGELLSVRP